MEGGLHGKGGIIKHYFCPPFCPLLHDIQNMMLHGKIWYSLYRSLIQLAIYATNFWRKDSCHTSPCPDLSITPEPLLTLLPVCVHVFQICTCVFRLNGNWANMSARASKVWEERPWRRTIREAGGEHCLHKHCFKSRVDTEGHKDVVKFTCFKSTNSWTKMETRPVLGWLEKTCRQAFPICSLI